MRNEPRTLFSCPPIRGLALLALLATPAAAQTDISGQIFDGSGGPLLAGQVYHVTANLTVPSGQTLTIQPGAILKVDGASIAVLGTLSAVATPMDPIWITSIFDDSRGGDTNGDGTSAGTPGDWNGLYNTVNSTCTLDQVIFEYGGGGSLAPLDHARGALSVNRCSFNNSLGPGIDLNQWSQLPTITFCSFENNGTYPIEGASIDAIASMSGNMATGNGSGNYVPVRDGTTNGDVTIAPANLIGGVLVFAVEGSVQATHTLTLEAGVVVKWLDAVAVFNRHFRLSGTLITRGTKNNQVVMTSLADDEHGGDTNGDGPSAGAPGDWGGIRVDHTGFADLEFTLLAFGGGHNAWRPFFTVNGGAPGLRLSHVTIRDSQGQGMDLSPQGVVTEVASCSFIDNETYPVDGLSFAQLENFRRNKSSGHGTSDAFRVTYTDIDTARPTTFVTAVR